MALEQIKASVDNVAFSLWKNFSADIEKQLINTYATKKLVDILVDKNAKFFSYKKCSKNESKNGEIYFSTFCPHRLHRLILASANNFHSHKGLQDKRYATFPQF